MKGLSSKDKQFMEKAAQAGHAEVAAGKLADSKSSNAEVKRFGRKMVQDHEKAGDELKKIAQSKGVTLPEEPDSAHKTLAKKREAAKADEFDRLYVTEAGVKDHKAAVDLFTDQAKNGQDSDLKSFAAKTLPTIKEHWRRRPVGDRKSPKHLARSRRVAAAALLITIAAALAQAPGRPRVALSGNVTMEATKWHRNSINPWRKSDRDWAKALFLKFSV